MQHLVAHDLRDLLTIVIGYCERVERAGDLERARSYARKARGVAWKCNGLVGAIFANNRRPAGGFDLNAVVGELARLLPSLLFEHGIKLQINLGPSDIAHDPSPLRVAGDSLPMFCALLNLCANARRALSYNTSGTLTIKTDRVNGSVSVAVSDTGIGMSQKQLSTIWNFRPPPGSEHGHGLQMVKGTVDRLSGKIDVVSVLGEGTTVTIVLPAEKA
jgi:signal transduction histidine kinase